MKKKMTAAEKKKILDSGGKLPDAEADFWQGLSDAQKRDLAILPILMHEAMAQVVEKHGGDISPDVFHFLNVSASRAMLFHSNPRALAKVLEQDCQKMLAATKAEDAQQAILVVAYLTLQLVEEGRVPNAAESQAVLCATAIMHEAQEDERGTGWRLDGQKVAAGAANLRERLEFHGYLRQH